MTEPNREMKGDGGGGQPPPASSPYIPQLHTVQVTSSSLVRPTISVKEEMRTVDSDRGPPISYASGPFVSCPPGSSSSSCGPFGAVSTGGPPPVGTSVASGSAPYGIGSAPCPPPVGPGARLHSTSGPFVVHGCGEAYGQLDEEPGPSSGRTKKSSGSEHTVGKFAVEESSSGPVRRPELSEDLELFLRQRMKHQGKSGTDDLESFLQQQKQRQARLETTMRSFPSSCDMEGNKQDLKRKRNSHEDPLSHRVIEKRRRDRMNNCLADLSRLIPTSYMKKGRGRVEKTEIIEMAIKHMKHLQGHACKEQESCELVNEIEAGLSRTYSMESFRVGYHECLTELMHFLVEKEGLYSGDAFCVRTMTHLQKHYDRLGRANISNLMSNSHRTQLITGQTMRQYLASVPASATSSTASTNAVSGDLGYHGGASSDHGRDEIGVKSEISDESGYGTVKPENLSIHQGNSSMGGGSSQGEEQAGHEQGEPVMAHILHRQRALRVGSYSPETMCSREYPSTPHEADDQPSDLRTRNNSDSVIEIERDGQPGPSGQSTNQYKFKSNIRHRFNQGQTEPLALTDQFHAVAGQQGFRQNHSETLEKRPRFDSAGSEPDQVLSSDNTAAGYHAVPGARRPASVEPMPMALELTAQNRRYDGNSSSQRDRGAKASSFPGYADGGVTPPSRYHHATAGGARLERPGNDYVTPPQTFIKSSPSPDIKQPFSHQPSPQHTASSGQSSSVGNTAHFGSPVAAASIGEQRDEKPCCPGGVVGGGQMAMAGPSGQTQQSLRSSLSTGAGGVPIFALNTKGSFYVPMSVDLSVISPYLPLLSEESCSVLHPVTISVNFQPPHVANSNPAVNNSQRTSGVIQQPSVIKRWKDTTG